MTLKDCYLAVGGNYDDVIGRLRTERLVQKFVLKFPADGSYKLLVDSLESGDVSEAFRAAHTIKGMCQNLSFTTLEKSASAITEMLRSGDLASARQYLPAVQTDYDRTVQAIAVFAAEVNA